MLGKDKIKELYPEIISLCQQRLTTEDLLTDMEAPEMQKYDEFIPHSLLRKVFAFLLFRFNRNASASISLILTITLGTRLLTHRRNPNPYNQENLQWYAE